MPNTAKAFRALTGISVYDKDDVETKRFEAGDKITDMSENELASEIDAGYVEEWSDDAEKQSPLLWQGEADVEAQEAVQEPASEPESVDEGEKPKEDGE